MCHVQAHSPIKPVLVFVSSRRQTRLTALDLIGFAAGDERPRQFVHCPEEELDQAVATIKVQAPLTTASRDRDSLHQVLRSTRSYYSVRVLNTFSHCTICG